MDLSGKYGKKLDAYLIELGDMLFFMGRAVREFFSSSFSFQEFVKQSYVIGYKTLPIVALTGFILGVVLTLQVSPVMARFGAESWIPGMVSVAIIREIGPIITGLICAGKVGSSIGAEIGSMKVTEQLDAMEVSGANPMSFVVSTRVLAATLMVPLLTFFAAAVSLLGAYLGVQMNNNMAWQVFRDDAFSALTFVDINQAAIKTVFFGFMIGLIGAYNGYRAKSGTEGVGAAANESVVKASIAIFIIDLVAVQFSQLF